MSSLISSLCVWRPVFDDERSFRLSKAQCGPFYNKSSETIHWNSLHNTVLNVCAWSSNQGFTEILCQWEEQKSPLQTCWNCVFEIWKCKLTAYWEWDLYVKHTDRIEGFFTKDTDSSGRVPPGYSASFEAHGIFSVKRIQEISNSELYVIPGLSKNMSPKNGWLELLTPAQILDRQNL